MSGLWEAGRQIHPTNLRRRCFELLCFRLCEFGSEGGGDRRYKKEEKEGGPRLAATGSACVAAACLHHHHLAAAGVAHSTVRHVQHA